MSYSARISVPIAVTLMKNHSSAKNIQSTKDWTIAFLAAPRKFKDEPERRAQQQHVWNDGDASSIRIHFENACAGKIAAATLRADFQKFRSAADLITLHGHIQTIWCAISELSRVCAKSAKLSNT